MMRPLAMADPHGDVLQRALAGDAQAQRELVAVLLPVIRARCLVGLRRRAHAARRGRDPRQECADLTQEVLMFLVADRCRVLRAWDPARGLSLKNYVGLIAARQVSSILRTGRRSPWTDEPTMESELAELAGVVGAEPHVIAKELLSLLVGRLHEEMSPRSMMLFRAVVVDETEIEEVCRDFAMTNAAVYAWRSRLLRRVRQLAVELQGPDSTRGEEISAVGSSR
jgi:DNA-directed RNA polymerase specialized sigma24 family protein